MSSNLLLKNKSIILYGISLAVLLFLLKWLELRFVIIDHALEIYSAGVAILFTGLGIWLAVKLLKPKTVIIEKEVFVERNSNFVFAQREMQRLGLSKRELEVLQLIAEGLSNQEIAGRLFLSLNTVKTHSSKIFEKLEVKRRIQAIEKAKRLNLIP